MPETENEETKEINLELKFMTDKLLSLSDGGKNICTSFLQQMQFIALDSKSNAKYFAIAFKYLYTFYDSDNLPRTTGSEKITTKTK